jgi:ubiquinol-cytochrome c reductase cytochrome b subunit
MVNALCVIVGLAALLNLAKGKGSFMLKVGFVVAAAVLIALMKTLDAKFWGVVLMGGAVVILFFLPWLDQSPAKSIRYRPGWHKLVVALFVLAFLILGYQGVQPAAPSGSALERLSQACTLIYFGFFLLMPWWSRQGTFKPVPDRVTFTGH